MRLATGTVVRFDETRGYGFISPDDGGEDVFMHANSLTDEKQAFVPGVPVEFEVAAGDRGQKALSVRVLRRTTTGVDSPTPASLATNGHAGHRQTNPDQSGHEGPADGTCDLLSSSRYTRELTDVMLSSTPSLTGAQILTLRADLVSLARRHGWVEG